MFSPFSTALYMHLNFGLLPSHKSPQWECTSKGVNCLLIQVLYVRHNAFSLVFRVEVLYASIDQPALR